MDTAHLIERLAEQAQPVRPLPSPWKRAVLWLAVATPCVALVVVVMSPRPDIAARLADTRFVVELVAAIATAIFAAVAAFACTVPGRSRLVCVLPMVTLAIWLASVGQGCFRDWMALGSEGLKLQTDWACVLAAALAGLVPSIAMVAMLRRGAPVFPRASLVLGALAVGALANAGAQFFHVGDVSIMVLVWHLGSVALLSMVAGVVGRLILRWPDRATLLRQTASG